MGALQAQDLGGKIVSRNPANGEILGEVPDMAPAEVKQAVARAREAQRAWGQLSVAERAQRVRRFRDQIVKRAPELCELISAEGGKTRSEALAMEGMLMADPSTYFRKR